MSPQPLGMGGPITCPHCSSRRDDVCLDTPKKEREAGIADEIAKRKPLTEAELDTLQEAAHEALQRPEIELLDRVLVELRVERLTAEGLSDGIVELEAEIVSLLEELARIKAERARKGKRW